MTRDRFETYFRIAKELGFESITYQDLAGWRWGGKDLPDRPIMFDFDHPESTIGGAIRTIMDRFGYRGNLFVNTAPIEKQYPAPGTMTWEEMGWLVDAGWHIGAHTHNHYDLDYLSKQDPSGNLIRAQLEICDELIDKHLGVLAQDFAYTSTTWSETAETAVAERYRFARFWITGQPYSTDRGPIRYAELVGVGEVRQVDAGKSAAAGVGAVVAVHVVASTLTLIELISYLKRRRLRLAGLVPF